VGPDVYLLISYIRTKWGACRSHCSTLRPWNGCSSILQGHVRWYNCCGTGFQCCGRCGKRGSLGTWGCVQASGLQSCPCIGLGSHSRGRLMCRTAVSAGSSWRAMAWSQRATRAPPPFPSPEESCKGICLATDLRSYGLVRGLGG
jgi:hypothetical protein